VKRMGRLMAALLTLCLHTPAGAVHTRFWELHGFERMLSGESNGLSLTPEGVLLLAPDLLSLPLELPGFPPQPFLWRAVQDGHGNLFVGSGIRGLVYRVTPQGKVEQFFQVPELEVHALAVDGAGALLVGSSPPGRVYRVQPDGSVELFYEPLERYIWDLALGRDGTLYVATGERGILYKVSPEGDAEVLFDSNEPHLVSLAVDVDGMVYAGSSGSGHLYRIGPDGMAQVVMDTDAQEVAHLALTPDGTVFAAVNSIVPPEEKKKKDDKEPDERLAGEMPGATTPVPLGLEDLAGAREELLADTRQETALTLRSALYRIPPVGPPSTVWSSEQSGIHSLLVEPDGRAYFGTGVPGRLYLLEDGQAAPRLLARFPESQVTSLAGGARSVLYAGTSNPGRLYRAVEEHGHSGEYLSQVRDAGAMARWGQVRWDATAPAGSRVEVSSRSGNSSTPDNTWSDWSTAYDIAEGSQVSSPPARFLQLRVRLSRLGEAPTPRLRRLQVSYQEENRPPELSGLQITPADQEEDAEPNAPRRQGTPQEMNIRWNAQDPNDDEMDFDLFLISVHDPETRTALASGWSDSTFRWDTTATPAGTYRVQLHASDGRDNDARSALAAQITSEPLVVDRTPPTLAVLSSSGQGSRARITFEVSDAVSPIVRAEYATGDPPQRHRIAAVDGLDDQRVERYALVIPDLAPGSHRIRLTAEDREGNRASTTVTVEVEP